MNEIELTLRNSDKFTIDADRIVSMRPMTSKQNVRPNFTVIDVAVGNELKEYHVEESQKQIIKLRKQQCFLCGGYGLLWSGDSLNTCRCCNGAGKLGQGESK